MPITDAAMISAAAGIADRSFKVTAVDLLADHSMKVSFTISGEPGGFTVILPLPSSPELKPWLWGIPEDAEDAADSLALFIREEVETGCAHWALTVRSGHDQLFELASYGFRRADPAEHRRLLKSAGVDGWSGRHHENDDPTQTPGGREQARLAALTFSYPEVGATATALPSGYQVITKHVEVGQGPDAFTRAAVRLLTWEAHLRTGLLVHADRHVTTGQNAVFELRIGPWGFTAPVRVIDVVHTATSARLTYGTLPGHPLRGEEQVTIRLGSDGVVQADILRFSRPAKPLSQLASPVVSHYHRKITDHLLAALK